MVDAALPLLVEAAKPIVEAVVSWVVGEVQFIGGFQKELQNLQRRIEIIGGIVSQMSDVSDTAIKPWLKNTLRIIQNAEDMLDVLAYEKHRNIAVKRRPYRNVKRLIALPSKPVFFRAKMASWIQRINSDIEQALMEANTITQLKAVAASYASLPPQRTTISYNLQEV